MFGLPGEGLVPCGSSYTCSEGFTAVHEGPHTGVGKLHKHTPLWAFYMSSFSIFTFTNLKYFSVLLHSVVSKVCQHWVVPIACVIWDSFQQNMFLTQSCSHCLCYLRFYSAEHGFNTELFPLHVLFVACILSHGFAIWPEMQNLDCSQMAINYMSSFARKPKSSLQDKIKCRRLITSLESVANSFVKLVC